MAGSTTASRTSAAGCRKGHGVFVGIGGYAESGRGLLALAVYGEEPSSAVELWRGQHLDRTFDALSVSPFELVQFNPVGSELGLSGLFGGATIHLSILDLRSMTSTQLKLADQRSYAWSPDGAWLAVATGEQIVIYGSVRSDPIYVLPIGATTITWRAN